MALKRLALLLMLCSPAYAMDDSQGFLKTIPDDRPAATIPAQSTAVMGTADLDGRLEETRREEEQERLEMRVRQLETKRWIDDFDTATQH